MRLELPSPSGGVGSLVWISVLLMIVVFFTGVAVFNLFNGMGKTLSIIWLAFVAMLIFGNLYQCGGWRGMIAALAKNFAHAAFVEVERGADGAASLRYGFESFGRRFFEKPIDLARVGEVSWHAGQASGLSGRDCNDWMVAIWSHEIGHEGEWKRRNSEGKDIQIVTGHLARVDADKVGRSVVELLGRAGVRLTVSDEESAWRGGVVFLRERTGSVEG